MITDRVQILNTDTETRRHVHDEARMQNGYDTTTNSSYILIQLAEQKEKVAT